jgi:hypothetical protein
MRNKRVGMKIRLKVIAICAALFATIATAQPMVAATPVVILMPTVLNNPDFFEFSDAQKKKVALVAQNTNQIREALDQSILDARAELREELMKYKPDQKLVNFLNKEIRKQETQRLQLSIDCADGLRKAMSAEQWKMLIELAQQ